MGGLKLTRETQEVFDLPSDSFCYGSWCLSGNLFSDFGGSGLRNKAMLYYSRVRRLTARYGQQLLQQRALLHGRAVGENSNFLIF